MGRAALCAALSAMALAGCLKKEAGAPAPMLELPEGLVASCAWASGVVEVRRPGSAYWEPVGIGALFRQGDWLRTGELSQARIELFSGGGLDLEPGTVLVVGLAPRGDGAQPEPMLTVEAGAVRSVLAARDERDGAFSIETREGTRVRIAAVPGAQAPAVRVSREGEGTAIAVTEGSASLQPEGARARTLVTGQLIELVAGAVKESAALIDFPKSLSPGIDAKLRVAPGEPVHLRWAAAAGARGYRVQVARDLSFRQLVYDEQVESISLAIRCEGTELAWRVAARDGKGRTGEYGFARRLFCGRKDLLVSPADGASVKGARVSFSWREPPAGGRFELVVAGSRDLEASALVRRWSQRASARVDGLRPGVYFWGVFLESGEPLFAEPRRLVVERSSAGPRIRSPSEISSWGAR
ncbi:MAG: hypothetical protein ACOX6T_02355 [Myxococcales bacterium]|jgi:hypothetical protein